jgi:voltage-gated potassium channel
MSPSAPPQRRSPAGRVADVLTLIACRPRLLLAALGVVIVASATAYAVLERKGPIESLWWVVVTGSTVGYGDFYPETTAGRAVGAFLIISMFVLALCCGAQLTARLIPDPHVFTDEEQRRVFAALDRIERHSTASARTAARGRTRRRAHSDAIPRDEIAATVSGASRRVSTRGRASDLPARRGEALRRGAGSRRARPRGRRRHVLRAARPERRRQVHHDADADRPDPSRLR